MVGYASNSPHDTYRMYNPKTQQIIETRDVKWAEWFQPNPLTAPITSSSVNDPFLAQDNLEEKFLPWDLLIDIPRSAQNPTQQNVSLTQIPVQQVVVPPPQILQGCTY